MRIVRISVSNEDEWIDLVKRLANRLDDQGQVAVVTHPSLSNAESEGKRGQFHTPIGLSTTYSLRDSELIVSGCEITLDGVLDHLAPMYDYTVLVGFNDAEIPQISFGDDDNSTNSLVSVSDPAAVNIKNIVERVDEIDSYETLTSLVSQAKASAEAEKAGAIATFTGRVRAKEHDNDVVTDHLEFERYDEIADDRLAMIRQELEDRNGVFKVLMHHRTGIVRKGEDIVFVVVLAGHREEAFQTVEDGINRLKDEVPLFKKEVTVEDEFWAHE